MVVGRNGSLVGLLVLAVPVASQGVSVETEYTYFS